VERKMNISQIAIGGHMYALVPFALLELSKRNFENLRKMASDMGFRELPFGFGGDFYIRISGAVRREHPFLTHLAIGQAFDNPYEKEDREKYFALYVYGQDDGPEQGKTAYTIACLDEEGEPGKASFQLKMIPVGEILSEKLDTAVCLFRA
jgi:hypothetical protein